MPASNTKILTAVDGAARARPGLPLHHRRRPPRDGDRRRPARLALPGRARRPDQPPVGLHGAARAGARGRASPRITGKIVADGSFFDAQRYNPGWFTSYASEYYAAQTAALTVAPDADYDTGTVLVKVKGGAPRPQAHAEHDAGGGEEVRPPGQQRDDDGLDERVAVAQAGGNTITVRGHVRSGRTLVGPGHGGQARAVRGRGLPQAS